MKTIRQLSFILFLPFLVLLWTDRSGAAEYYLKLEDSIKLDLGTWSGSGDIDFDSNDFCVTSQIRKKKKWGGWVTNSKRYKVKALNVGARKKPFRLKKGSDLLLFSLTYMDTVASSSESLEPNTFSGLMEGLTKKQRDHGNTNGQVNIFISESALLAAPAGHYEQSIKFVFRQQGNNARDRRTFTASITIPDLVRVSELDNIDLGTWNGNGNLSGSDGICVYRNSSSGYTATFTGNGGSGAPSKAFLLTNGATDIPYTVVYDDGTLELPVTAGIPLTGRTGHHESSPTCDGGINGTITVTVLESVMEASPSSVYIGTLTILVAPE